MRTLSLAAVVLALAAPALGQQVQLDFQDGRVTLDASSVPVRTILAEWARLGGTKVVNGDKVTGAPVTLRLENVPEAEALAVILRNVAGYMAAPRRPDSVGASAYDRILVLPTSAAPAASTASRAPAAGRGNAPLAGAPRVRGGPQPFVADEPVQDVSDTGVNEPPAPFAFPEQNPFQGAGQPGPFGTPVTPNGQPVFQFTPGAQGGFGGVSVNPVPQQSVPIFQFPGTAGSGTGTGGGFGVVGAPTPGMVVQPQPPQPGQRPPGDR